MQIKNQYELLYMKDVDQLSLPMSIKLGESIAEMI